MAISNISLNSDTIFVSVRCKGASTSLPLTAKVASSARLKEPSLLVYEDGKLLEKVQDVRKFLFDLSKSAMVTSPSSSTFAVPSEEIGKLKSKLDAIDTEVEYDLQYIVDNYDDIKAQNFDEIKKAIVEIDEEEQKKILARAEYRYPSITEIKTGRQMLISIMASPIAGSISNIEVLKDRVEDDARARYKEAVFLALDPVYKALATYYTKLSNGQEIGTKSKNFFLEVIAALKEQNQIRRDGFTEDVIAALEKYSNEVFEDTTLDYTIVLNIYKEAIACDSLHVLTDIEKMERRLMKGYPSATRLLEEATIDEDAAFIIPIKALL